MAALSITTVALSLADGCPGLAFYILEIIINSSMILEVVIRFVAFGRVSTLRIDEPLYVALTPRIAILEVAF
jgi:hypothetical protein